MEEPPPFDTVKASFFLIAGIIAVHCIVVLAGVVECIIHVDMYLTNSRECDPKSRLSELLSAALAAALAFAGGVKRGP